MSEGSVAVAAADRLQLLDDDFEDHRLGGEHGLEMGDPLQDLAVLVDDLAALEPGQTLQPHLQDRLRLQLGERELAHQAGSCGRRIGGAADQLDHALEFRFLIDGQPAGDEGVACQGHGERVLSGRRTLGSQRRCYGQNDQCSCEATAKVVHGMPPASETWRRPGLHVIGGQDSNGKLRWSHALRQQSGDRLESAGPAHALWPRARPCHGAESTPSTRSRYL